MKTTNDKHTPGPWYPLPEYSNGGEVHSAAGRICDASIGLGERQKYRDAHRAQSEANARLIAAAPDLLAALQNLVETAPGDIECDDNLEKYRSFVLRVACAAVAAVEGGAA